MNNQIKIIHEDSAILIVHKPIRMLSHPERKLRLPDLLTELGHPEYSVITRLDVNTSGLVLIAKNARVSSKLGIWMREGKIHKSYVAACIGFLPKNKDRLEAFLLKDSEEGTILLSQTPIEGADKIITEYNILEEKNQLSLVEVSLVTGKTHQIRAHMAMIGNPILGDPLYGNKRFNAKHSVSTQCLASWRITFDPSCIDPLIPSISGKSFTDSFRPFGSLFK